MMETLGFIFICILALAMNSIPRSLLNKYEKIRGDGRGFLYLLAMMALSIGFIFLEPFLLQIVIRFLFKTDVAYWWAFFLDLAISCFFPPRKEIKVKPEQEASK